MMMMMMIKMKFEVLFSYPLYVQALQKLSLEQGLYLKGCKDHYLLSASGELFNTRSKFQKAIPASAIFSTAVVQTMG